ncbi:MAG: hypothetical protein ACI90V_008666 [Bacillariaceae sp.]
MDIFSTTIVPYLVLKNICILEKVVVNNTINKKVDTHISYVF